MINKGDKVIIIGSAEETKYNGCVFEVLSKPYDVCGSTVVKMKCNETGNDYTGTGCMIYCEPYTAEGCVRDDILAKE